jgi:hypothetical protein
MPQLLLLLLLLSPIVHLLVVPVLLYCCHCSTVDTAAIAANLATRSTLLLLLRSCYHCYLLLFISRPAARGLLQLLFDPMTRLQRVFLTKKFTSVMYALVALPHTHTHTYTHYHWQAAGAATFVHWPYRSASWMGTFVSSTTYACLHCTHL